MKRYLKELEIPHYDCDKEGIIFPSNIVKYLSEISMTHDAVAQASKKAADCGWMLNKWRIFFKEYPKAGDKIEIETWVSKVDRFYVTREFRIYKNGLELIRASALWIYINMEKKRPVRIKEEDFNYEDIIEDFNFDGFNRLDFKLESDNQVDFAIRRTDIDSNQHVNNVKYIDWILEAIDNDFYEENKLVEFEIEYKKEIKYPGKILSIFSREDRELKHIVKSSDEINVLASSKWESIK